MPRKSQTSNSPPDSLTPRQETVPLDSGTARALLQKCLVQDGIRLPATVKLLLAPALMALFDEDESPKNKLALSQASKNIIASLKVGLEIRREGLLVDAEEKRAQEAEDGDSGAIDTKLATAIEMGKRAIASGQYKSPLLEERDPILVPDRVDE